MKYRVTLKETLIYHIEVEADSPGQAENEAFESEAFAQNLCDENDTVVEKVEEI